MIHPKSWHADDLDSDTERRKLLDHKAPYEQQAILRAFHTAGLRGFELAEAMSMTPIEVANKLQLAVSERENAARLGKFITDFKIPRRYA